MRTLHLGLRVADPPRAVTFYGAVGYEVVGRVPNSPSGDLTMLKLPGEDLVSLELVFDGAEVGQDRGRNLSHFAIMVESMTATVTDLRTRAIEVAEPVSPDGSADFLTTVITDPDGNRVELVQWPAGHPAGLTAADWAPGP